jgi:hypothetical protein
MDRLMTKTLAEIYLQQGHLQEAYDIYKTLAEKDPSDAEIQKRLEELREKLDPSAVSSFLSPFRGKKKYVISKNGFQIFENGGQPDG